MEQSKIEGWLYVIRPHRVRIRALKRFYFVLEGRAATCLKSKPDGSGKVSLKKGIIPPFTKVDDHGRETIHGRILHTFTLFDPSNAQRKLKLGAEGAEEAAKWMLAFKGAAQPSQVPVADESGSKKKTGRLPRAKTAEVKARPVLLDWTEPWTKQNQADVITESPWRIVGCSNGLRLFRESSKAKGRFRTKFSDDHPAVMAIGMIKGTCETIFDAVMSLGAPRIEWDFCYSSGRVVEHIDGHTDIIHEKLRRSWLPGHMRRRDLLTRRYWRREDDGSYVILYRSVTHKDCPSRATSGVVRANLQSGGFVISPLQDGSTGALSLVRHMLEIDWKTWKSHFKPSRVQKITIRMLKRIAALRELQSTKSCQLSLVEPVKEATVAKPALHEDFKSAKFDLDSEESQESFLALSDTDQFFDPAGEESDEESPEESASSTSDTEDTEADPNKKVPKLSATATFVKRIHEMAAAAQKKEASKEEGVLDREGTLPKSSVFNSNCCWDEADPGTFLVRGKHYLRDQKKVKAKDTLMKLVAVDWYQSTQRMDHVASSESNFMQKPRVRKLNRCFFFIVNLQVPGATTYSLVLYYMMKESLGSVPLLEKFVNGDDLFRRSRLKLIPHVAEGSWIVKQSVGKTACLLGEALDINYHEGENYLELDVDVGSSSVAKGVVSLVFGYMKKLVVEMAFLVQANTEDELPEALIGTCRISSLDVSKAVQFTPEA